VRSARRSGPGRGLFEDPAAFALRPDQGGTSLAASSIANQRIDDDSSRHIGLDSHGAAIVRTVFRT
jgi:hypothetical protein